MQTKTELAIQKKIDDAQEKIKKLKAQQTRARARRKAIESKKDRADDTRRKILLGAFMQKTHSEVELREKMDGYLVEPRDRALFGLTGSETPGEV